MPPVPNIRSLSRKCPFLPLLVLTHCRRLMPELVRQCCDHNSLFARKFEPKMEVDPLVQLWQATTGEEKVTAAKYRSVEDFTCSLPFRCSHFTFLTPFLQRLDG